MKTHKILNVLLLVYGGLTAFNTLYFYFFPLIIPTTNFSIMKILFVAFAEHKYIYVVGAALFALLILASGAAVRKKRIVLPVLSFIFILVDLVHVASLLGTGSVRYTHISVFFSGGMDVLFIILFVRYFKQYLKCHRILSVKSDGRKLVHVQ